ncbi:MAG: rnhA operon protein [Haloarculaceae archaeon]
MPDETPAPDDGPASDLRDDPSESDDDRPADTPPERVVEEAERLTRLARDAAVDAEAAAYREDRDSMLADHDYTARVREDDTRDVLVLHPAEWVEDGTIRPDRIENVDRGIELPLSGPGEGDDWAEIDAYNREIVATVREEHGDDHAANVTALADFMGNHYAKPIDGATREELEEFLTDYYRRNAWPTPEQRDVVEKSVRLAFEAVDERCPIERSR